MIEWLDGKKTVLGIIFYAATNIYRALSGDMISPEIIDIFQTLAEALAGVGAAHKLAKLQKK